MSIKIYSGYDEFKYEESELCQYIEEEEKYEENDCYEEESDDLFFISNTNSNFRDSSVFYIVADLEDEDNAEDISAYLGKFNRIDIPDFHKVLFCVI
jgi:hypothetical protein